MHSDTLSFSTLSVALLNRAQVVALAWIVWSMSTTALADDFFERKVRPILVERCYECHSGEKQGGGLSLETAEGWRQGGDSGPTIVPGHPEESLLIEAINYQSLEMPPPDSGGQLSEEEIKTLTLWVAEGAIDPRTGSSTPSQMSVEEAQSWWAFQPLVNDASSISSQTIDSILQAEIDRLELTPSERADKRTLIRRATYDLTGLPPTPEEVDAFLADKAENAFEKVVDRLLDSPEYGIRRARQWLDVVRYADTAGENTDRPLPHIWRYRNWVIDAFNNDLSFDLFTRMQIAGDIPRGQANDWDLAQGKIATGYIAVARRFGHDIDKDIHLTYEDLIDNLGKNFLGLSFGCARCHDHKYDAISAEDYYALYGIFASTRLSFPGCEPRGQPAGLIPLVNEATVQSLNAEYEQKLAEYVRQTKGSPEETARLKNIAADSYRVLSSNNVEEGQSVELHDAQDDALSFIELQKGEVLQLTVLPNGNHGADTTRVELQIDLLNCDLEVDQSWNVNEVVSSLTDAGPIIEINNASWCFLDVTDGPMFLYEKKPKLDGVENLSAWSIGGTPSVVANASESPISVWTTLPPRSFFVHPGVNRNVAVAWVCPQDGTYKVSGMVSDAHPAGLDGVSFRFEHFASAEFGNGLIDLGQSITGDTATPPVPPNIPVAFAVEEAEPVNVSMQLRGDPEQEGNQVRRRWLELFGGHNVADDQGSGRQQLSHWIVENPLFSRVIVNRVWQWHFGRGIVATANDFGTRGSPPTHPELLELLAASFREGGYRLKPLQKMILLSEAYQRSGVQDPSQVETDPDNRWLSRFDRRRLTAEEIRDSILFASGELDRSFAEAHPFPPEASWTFTQHNPFNAVYDTNKRSIFLMVQRQRRHPYLALFDGADPNSSTAVRQSTTVPTQALYFLNDPFYHERADSVARRVLKATDEDTRLRFVFQLVFQREPTGDEAEIAQRFVAEYPGTIEQKWSAYARVLMASNEFIYVD